MPGEGPALSTLAEREAGNPSLTHPLGNPARTLVCWRATCAQTPAVPKSQPISPEGTEQGEADFIPPAASCLDTHPERVEQVPTRLFRVLQTIIFTTLSPVEGHSQHQGNPARLGAACVQWPVPRPKWQVGLGASQEAKSSTPISKAQCRLRIAMPRCPVLLSCHTRFQAAQGTNKHSSAHQRRGECAGLLASCPSIAWLSLKSKAGASDTNCFLCAGSCRVQPCGNGKRHRELVPIRRKSITLSTFEFQRKSGRRKTKPAPHSQEGPGAKQMTWNRHHRRRKGAFHPCHVVWLVLPPRKRPRKGTIQEQKPSLPTSGSVPGYLPPQAARGSAHKVEDKPEEQRRTCWQVAHNFQTELGQN